MAGDQRAVTVTTTATRLDTVNESDSVSGSSVALYNNGSVTVYIGLAATVTAATGFPLAAGSSMSFQLDGPGDTVFGIVASGTADVRVLEGGI